MKYPVRFALIFLLCSCMTGCLHRQVRVVVLTIPRSPVDLIAVEEPDLPDLEEADAAPELEVPSASGVERETPRWRKRTLPRATAAAPAAPPPAVASVSAPVPEPDPAAVIGELSVGGDTTHSRQQAAEIIETTDRRLASLSLGTRHSKHTQVAQVRDFQEKARTAVRSGDADGAMTLATKAALLLDDLLK